MKIEGNAAAFMLISHLQLPLCGWLHYNVAGDAGQPVQLVQTAQKVVGS